MSGPRKVWIDIAKGIGITSVVIAHVWDKSLTAHYLKWFHMPLFFILAGYLFRLRAGQSAYLLSKSRQLLVPYFVYLSYIALPTWAQLLSHNVSVSEIVIFGLKQLYGGYYLKGQQGVFWFITCLFLTQQTYYWSRSRLGRKGMLILASALYLISAGYSVSSVQPKLPWSLEVVPLAFVFFFIGHYFFDRISIGSHVFIGALLVVVGAAVIERQAGLDFNLSMKYGDFGVPGLQLILAIACVLCVIQLSKWIESIGIVSSALSLLGTCSMVIMFLHQPIQMTMSSLFCGSVLGEELTRFAAAILIPTGLFFLFKHSKIISRFFLGHEA